MSAAPVDTEKERTMRNPIIFFAVLWIALGLAPVWAQDPGPKAVTVTNEHANHGSGATEEANDKTGAQPAAGGMDHGAMQGGSAPPDARDPHAYSGGYDFGPFPLHLADHHNFYSLLVDNLEAVRARDGTSAAYDLQGWFGRDYNRVALKAEGEVNDGRLQEARTELLWGHAVAAYWNTQLGVRYDSGIGPGRGWLAFGLQGLAPYWFEVDTAVYISEAGHTALRLDVEYELLLTQKLILQPRIEADFYGKRDARRGVGAGLSSLSLGVRLRYEIRRAFAPYLGIEWAGKYGDSADFARAVGEDDKETRLVAGLRLLF
jgi:copper resistance protein B